ncbi:MAG: hypothetical protein ABIO29_03295 [Sphingomicrobium sp.]
MIPLLFAAVALADAPKSCPDVITPEAMICRGIRAQSNGQFRDAAQAFEQAAIASPDNDPTTARLWAAAGNMWIAASENGKAAFALDKALAVPGLVGDQRGEALIDRARAAEAMGDLKIARSRLDQAMQFVSEDPFAWFFSAALAIREGDPIKAQAAINHALTLAPAEPIILFEAGHVAQFAGDEAKAKSYWQQVVAADGKSEIGKAARQALELLAAPAPKK